jgi:hypothetical protein
MQTSSTKMSVFECARSIVKKEGYKKLYGNVLLCYVALTITGGLSAQLSISAILQSVVFGSNRFFNDLLKVDRERLVTYEDYARMAASGTLTGLCISVLATPTDQAKVL